VLGVDLRAYAIAPLLKKLANSRLLSNSEYSYSYSSLKSSLSSFLDLLLLQYTASALLLEPNKEVDNSAPSVYPSTNIS
jgi:hypothetical protein